jgi:putative endonuclease
LRKRELLLKTGETGRRGELAAAQYLRRIGCDILAANFRTRFGEVDIIAADSNYIIFAEVKTRAKNSMLLPREAVDYKKQQKIIKAASQYLSVNRVNLQPRFDVIEITTTGGEEFAVLSLNHIKNAFSLS